MGFGPHLRADQFLHSKNGYNGKCNRIDPPLDRILDSGVTYISSGAKDAGFNFLSSHDPESSSIVENPCFFL